jgi:hypothetical protein
VELFNKVRQTFKAIAVNSNKTTKASVYPRELNASFTAKIKQLEQRYTALEEDCARLTKEGAR